MDSIGSAPPSAALVRWWCGLNRLEKEKDEDVINLHRGASAHMSETFAALVFVAICSWNVPLPQCSDGAGFLLILLIFVMTVFGTIASALLHQLAGLPQRSFVFTAAWLFASLTLPLLPVWQLAGWLSRVLCSFAALALLWGTSPAKQEAMAICGLCEQRPATRTCLHCDRAPLKGRTPRMAAADS